MDITLVYQKERKDFGRATNHFAMSEVTVLPEEFFPEQGNAELVHIERNPTVLDIEAKPPMSESIVRRTPRLAPPLPAGSSAGTFACALFHVAPSFRVELLCPTAVCGRQTRRP